MNCPFSVCARNYMRGPKCPSQARMDSKIVIVTGANSGIGLETAKNLLLRGKQAVQCSNHLVCLQIMFKEMSTV